MKNKQVLNYWVDALLLIGFLVAFFLDLTGLEGHQLLGAAVAVFSAYHLVLHWDWVKAVTRKLFGKAAAQAKIYYVLDAILLAGLALVSVTGLVISTWLGLELVDYVVWLDLHILISIATLLALVLKIGLHWKWIVKTSQKIFHRQSSPVRGLALQPRLQPAPAAVDVSRREFISLMSVVGVTSIIAASNGLGSLNSAEAASDGSSQVSLVVQSSPSTTGSTSSSPTSSSSSSSSTTTITGCRIRCNKGCSYPGRCRKYVDANGNKKCDLGECL